MRLALSELQYEYTAALERVGQLRLRRTVFAQILIEIESEIIRSEQEISELVEDINEWHTSTARTR